MRAFTESAARSFFLSLAVIPLLALAPVALPASAAGGAVSSAATPPDSVPVTAFVDVDVLPMDGRGPLSGRTVLVAGEAIVGMGPSAEVRVPDGARVVEGDGRWLLPGLTDAHVHLRAEPEAWLDLFLANGVTTVFNLRGDATDLALRRRVAAGATAGPTVYTAGPYLDEMEIRSEVEADSILGALAEAGYDFAKIHGSMTADAFRWVAGAAHRRGMPVVGHVPRNLALETVLAAGMDMISHAEEIVYGALPELSRERVSGVADRVAARSAWVIPTLAGFAQLAEQWGSPEALARRMDRPETRYLNRELHAFWTDGNPYVHRPSAARNSGHLDRQLRLQEDLVAALRDAGVRLLAGTDTPFPTMYPGFSLHEELAALRSAGLTAEEVLRAATSNPGAFIRSRVRSEDRFGSVAVGYRADLLLVTGDPRDDLQVLQNPVGVMARGRWLPRGDLDRRLASVAAAADAGDSHARRPSRSRLRVVAGRYASESPAFDVRVRVDSGRLVVEDARRPEERPRYRLVSTEEGAFRVLGGPFPMLAEFDPDAQVMTLRKPGSEGEAFARLRRVEGARGPEADSVDVREAGRGASARLEELAAEGAGLSAAVGWNGRIVWAAGHGWADLETPRPMTPETPARVYSVSKGFTAVAAARLVERGALRLEAPVQEYVPDFPPKRGTVTPLHLLTHTSGIRGYRGESEARSRRHCETIPEAVAIFADDSLVHAPGEGRTYSSWGYVLLSEVLSRAGDRSFDRLMRDEVLGPAAMDETVLAGAGRPVPGRAEQYVVEHGGEVRPAPATDVSCKWGAGGYLSTATDLVRFQQAVLGGGLIAEPMVDRIVRSRAETTPEGRRVHELSGWSGDGMAFLRTDLETGVVFALVSNAIGEEYGPRVQAAVPGLHALFVRAVSGGGDSAAGP